MSEWIKCSDAMPESYKEVLVWPYPSDTSITAQFGSFKSNGFQYEPCWHYADYETGYGWEEFQCITVTHWMPLPNPPEES